MKAKLSKVARQDTIGIFLNTCHVNSFDALRDLYQVTGVRTKKTAWLIQS